MGNGNKRAQIASVLISKLKRRQGI